MKLLSKISQGLPRSLLGSGFASLCIKLAGAVLAYGMIVAFAHFMTAEEYGRFAYGLNLAIIASTIAGFGFSTGIMRYWPKFVGANDFASARGVVRMGYMACGVGGLLIVLIAIASGLIAKFAFGADYILEWLVIACLGLVICFGDYSTNLLRAQGSIAVSMLPRDVLWRVFSVLVVGIIFWMGGVVSGVQAVLLSAIVLLVLTVWQIIHIRRNMAKLLQSSQEQLDWPHLRKSLVPLWASGIVFALIQQFDVVVVGSMLGSADAGAYFAAQKTAMLLSLVLIAAGLVAAPQMAALYHAHKRIELQALCRNLAGAIAVVTAIGFLFIVLVGKQLLALFDAQFVSAYPVLLIVAFGTMIDAVSGPSAYLMQMTEYERPYLRIMAVSYGLVICAQLILIPYYGSIGAALASAGGVVIWNVWSILILRRNAGLDPSLLSLLYAPRMKFET